MVCGRLFFFGVVILLIGLHFRSVDTFVLNDKSSTFLEEKIPKKKAESAPEPETRYVQSIDEWWASAETAAPAAPQRFKTLTPPNWLGWSLISVGSVLILTCPCFRN